MNTNQNNSNIEKSPQQSNDVNSAQSINADPKQYQKQEDHEAATKTAHAVGKGAATYFGGTVGNKLYDSVSKTKLGKTIESQAGKQIERTPMGMTMKPAMKNLNKTGALDAADKVIDTVGTGGKGGVSSPETSTANKVNSSANPDMLKGSSSKTGQLARNIVTSRPNNNQGYIQSPNFYDEEDDIDLNDIDIPEGVDPEEYKLALLEQRRQEQLQQQMLEEEMLREQQKHEVQKQKMQVLGQLIMKDPKVALILLGIAVIAIVIFFVIFLMVSDMDLIGSQMTSYSDAEVMTNSASYCSEITLIKEHDDYSGTAVSSIDDVDLSETFELNKKTVNRWSTVTYDLEKYVKGVVSAEANLVDDEKTYEAVSIVARTYTLQIANSSCYIWDNNNKRQEYKNPQKFTEQILTDVETAVSTTSGIVITLNDELLEITDTNYHDYFCYSNKTRDDDNAFYKMLQENKEEKLLVPIKWAKENNAEDKNYSGKNNEGIYNNNCQADGISLFGVKYLLNQKSDSYTVFRVLKYYYGYDTELKKVANSLISVYGCSEIDMKATTLTREQFISAAQSYATSSSKQGAKVLAASAGEIYDMSVQNNVNPELVFIRAHAEGYSPGTGYNYWGYGCTNNGGGKDCRSYSSLQEGVLAFLNNISQYNTIGDMMEKYANIGSSWDPSIISSGKGGCYYYEYIKQYMTTERSSVVAGVCNGGSPISTNDEDQVAYSKYQVSIMAKYRKEIFNLDSDGCVPGTDAQAIINSNASIGVKAAQLAVAMFDSFGYSQANRFGTNQVDCSSLVYRTYKELGITFGGASTVRTEYSWCQANNRLITESQLQPGDLLITPSLGHIEIYIGNGQRFGAHTSNASWDDQVSIKPYNSGYFTIFCRPY